MLILKLRAASSSHRGPLKASQFLRPRFLPKMRSITKGSAWLICRFLRGIFFFLQWTTSQDSTCLQLSPGSMGSPAPGRSPGGFWGFPRWAVRLKEWSGLENYGSFAITALSTFHLNLQQRGHTEHQDWAPFPLHSTTTKRNSRVRALLGWFAPIPPHPPQNLIHLVSTEILGILKQLSSFPTCSNMDQEGKTPDFSPVFL